LGISLRPRTAQLVLMDAAGNRLGMTRFAVSGPLDQMPALIRENYARWLASGEIAAPSGRLLAVGLGVPGVVDIERGIVLNSVGFHSENVPLQEKLSEQFPESLIVIDHDASSGAIAEAADGAAKDTSHFVYFAMNYNRQDDRNSLESFGSALYLEGRVYRGAHFAAGELSGLIAPRRDLVLDEQDLQAFAAEDGPLTPTMKLLAESVGSTLASIMNLLDLPLVVLGGNLNLANTAFVEAVRHRTARSLVSVPGRHLRIEASKVIGETVARGAAITAVQAVLEGGWLLANETVPAAAPQTAATA
jgi:predicted NBD/HSP70 family sugar kinase